MNSLRHFVIKGKSKWQLVDCCREFALAYEWVEAALARQRREGGGNAGIEILLRQVTTILMMMVIMVMMVMMMMIMMIMTTNGREEATQALRFFLGR